MNSQCKIRSATIDDVEQIRRLQAKSWCEIYRNDDLGITEVWLKQKTDKWLTKEELEKSKQFLKPFFTDSDQNFYRVAVFENKIIGFIHASVAESGNRRLWGLYVDSKYHGTGLAQQLMELANGWFADNIVELEVATYNERAKAFYRKNGFEEIKNSEFMFAEKIPTIKMIRKAKNEK